MSLVDQINLALPQTQCTRCGYPDCRRYAEAIAGGEADINQCPPGGIVGVERLATLTGKPVRPLNPEHGVEGPRTIAIIDEAWCIGCTLCSAACPTDAIMGANKRMHTVVEDYCTGCELCIPACPVDCISLEPVDTNLSGWAAWPSALADLARQHYQARTTRLAREAIEHEKHLQDKALNKLADLSLHTQGAEQYPEVERKRVIIKAALAKAKTRQANRT